jgi:hypothetical protein
VTKVAEVYIPANLPQPFLTLCSDELRVETISMPAQYVGDTVTIDIPRSFTIGSQLGVVIDLRNITAELGISSKQGTAPTQLLTLESVDGYYFTDQSENMVTLFEITPAITTALGPGNWYLEMEFSDESGRVKTVAVGYMQLVADTA